MLSSLHLQMCITVHAVVHHYPTVRGMRLTSLIHMEAAYMHSHMTDVVCAFETHISSWILLAIVIEYSILSQTVWCCDQLTD